MNSKTAVVLYVTMICVASAQQCPNGSAYLSRSIATIGGQLTVSWEDPASPWGPTGLLISDGLGPSTVTGFGAVCLDTTSPAFSLAYFGYLDMNGRATIAAAIPPYVDLAVLPPTFLMAVVLTPAGLVLSNPERLEFENPNSHKATENPMSTVRVFHSAVAMHLSETSLERRVLISGGGAGIGAYSGIDCYFGATATNSTDIFDPLTRSFSPGPMMSCPRVHHQSVLLLDGRVLICGGKDSLGTVTNSCEIFDPATNTFSAVQGMLEARAGHIATRLNDGRVFVSGGLGSFVGCAATGNNAQAVACFATLRTSGEIFDPLTGAWSSVANAMLRGRILHTQTLLLNGKVLIAAGFSWVTYPTESGYISLSECEIFDPTTNSFTPAASMPTILFLLSGNRYAHQAELLPDGNVFVTGGEISESIYNAWPQVYVTAFNYWVPTGALEGVNEIGRGYHRQATLPNGRTILVGGTRGNFIPFPTSTVLDLTPNSRPQFFRAPIGTNSGIPGAAAVPVSGHTLTSLYDGTFLIAGGLSGFVTGPSTVAPIAVDQAWVYIP